MPSAISHPAAVFALSPWLGSGAPRRRVLLLAVVGSVFPDVDAIGYWLGIPYESPFGHRGATHSLFFAALLAAALVAAFLPRNPGLWVFLFLCTASHGLLDTMTGGGGGVALLWPFDTTRFRLPWRPIRVSPIGVEGLFGPRGITIAESELLWIWLPSLALFSLGRFMKAWERRSHRNRNA